MNKKHLSVLLLLFICSFGALNTYSAPKYFSDNGKKKVAPDPIYNKTIIIPTGYELSVTINEDINVNNLDVPDKITTTINNDFIYKGQLIAPEGSSVIGMVVKSTKETCENDAQIKIKFTSIILPNSQVIPISAIFKTNNKKGIIYGNEGLKQDSKQTVIIMQPVTYTPR